MQTFEYTEKHITLKYPLEKLSEPASVIFLDIETTGLSPVNAEVYLIGTAALRDEKLYIRQFFAEDTSQEKEKERQDKSEKGNDR